MIESPILGFAPDLPSDTAGTIRGSSGILPTAKGIGNGVGVLQVSTGTMTGTSCGGASLPTLAATSNRKLIGTTTKLWELNTATATDVSGKAYSASVTAALWSFTSFGSVVLASNANDTLQASTTPLGAFADVAGAPKGNIVITAGPASASFAMLFDYDDGTRTKDGIFWSALSDYTDWTPAIATGCGNIRLLDINGPMTAAIPYRDGVIAFKANAMYRGTYVGPPAIWDWQRISKDVGCIGKNALCEANERIFFADSNGLWVYDGSYPQPMPGAVHQWWADQSGSFGFADYVRLTWDKTHNQIWLGYGFPANPTFLVFNTRTQVWTQYGQIVTGTLTTGELFDPLHVSTVDPNNPFTSTSFAKLSRLSSDAPAATARFAAYGKSYGTTTFRGCRPIFTTGPSDTNATWLSGTLYYGPSLRNVTSANDAMTFAVPGRLDAMRTSRFVAPSISIAAGTSWEMTRMVVDTQYDPAGE